MSCIDRMAASIQTCLKSGQQHKIAVHNPEGRASGERAARTLAEIFEADAGKLTFVIVDEKDRDTYPIGMVLK